MIKTDGMIAETAAKIYTDLCPREVLNKAEAGQYPQKLWDALAENGLTIAWASEEGGGFGADVAETFGAIWASAQAASPVPFAETLIANWLLDRAGLELAEGTASFAIAEGNSAAVPFAGRCGTAVIFDDAESSISAYKIDDTAYDPLPHLSPDGAVMLDLSKIAPAASAKTNLSRRGVEALVLTVRAVQMAAAMEAALGISIDYVSDREQFGRALSKFQAIQHHLAIAASEIAAATMAATLAADSFARHSDNPEQAWHDAVVAKVQIGHAIESATASFHQVHGAMGYTQEYVLHHYTRRLWAWRDELGNEHHWAERLGEELAAKSPDQIWKSVTIGEWQAS